MSDMDSDKLQPSTICHAVAMPYPGWGHINPMLNFCKLLVSRKNDILITFVVTEEWLGLIGSAAKPDNIRFSSIPDVMPPERLKAATLPCFFEAVATKMEAPFEQLLDRLEPPVTAIIADIEVLSTIGVGNRRSIPVASFWTMSASFFSMLYRFGLLTQNQLSQLDLLELVDKISGISSTEADDLRRIIRRGGPRVFQLGLECLSMVPKAQYLLFTSVYELEREVMDSLKLAMPFPVNAIGPAIPYLDVNKNFPITNLCHEADYLQWLDLQPANSVLYISFGSFLSVSNTQIDEILAGLQNSSVKFLWVARGEAARLKEICGGDMGFVVAWCDQLKVLCHSSVGGFWTHCGWNSTLEAVYTGVPMLTFPLFLDQDSNSRQIVEQWKIGGRVTTEPGTEKLVSREEIAEVVRRFMDLENSEAKEMRRRASELRGVCQQAIAGGGSSMNNLDAFIADILLGQGL